MNTARRRGARPHHVKQPRAFSDGLRGREASSRMSSGLIVIVSHADSGANGARAAARPAPTVTTPHGEQDPAKTAASGGNSRGTTSVFAFRVPLLQGFVAATRSWAPSSSNESSQGRFTNDPHAPRAAPSHRTRATAEPSSRGAASRPNPRAPPGAATLRTARSRGRRTENCRLRPTCPVVVGGAPRRRRSRAARSPLSRRSTVAAGRRAPRRRVADVAPVRSSCAR